MAKQVVSKIVAHLDPKNTIFKGFLSNKKCLKTKSSFYIKDLRIIADKNLKDMIIIDSNPFSFSFTLDNGIPILPWHGNADDCELPFLVSYLIKQTKYVNFQNEIAKNFKLSELAKSLNKAIITQT